MASAALIDGKAAAEALRGRLAIHADFFHASTSRAAGLATVLVGEDPASAVYVRSKIRATREAGMHGVHHPLPADTSEAELLELVAELNRDPAVDGILVQLPLPAQIDAARVIDAIDPDKDVDGFHVVNSGRLAVGDPTALVPCTPLGCLHLLKSQLGDLSGAEAVVIGRSNIVGKPMALLLLHQHATVTIAHSRTPDLRAMLQRADLVAVAAGKPQLVTGEMLKPGAVVIDFGINEIGEGQIVGDVDYGSAVEVAGAITPVPGGTGPVTNMMLLRNVLIAAQQS